MRIVIDAGSFFRDYPEVEMGRYFTDCLKQMVRGNPQSRFWVLSSPFFKHIEWSGIALEEISFRQWLPGKRIAGFLANRSIAAVTHHEQIQALLTIGRILSGHLRMPQFIWIPGDPGTRILERNPALIRKVREDAVFLLADSALRKTQWMNSHSLPGHKVQVVPMAVSESYSPLAWADKEQTKVKYAGGKEYFVSRTHFPEENLLNLLRAFSLFKKKQQSNMKLLIAGVAGEPDHVPYEKLETYKYRNDVYVYAGMAEEDFVKITASAYALVLPAEEVTVCSVLNAFQAQVPVISGTGRLPEAEFREAIMATESASHEMLAESMIRLFNNEDYRSELIRKGEIQAGRFSTQHAVMCLWQVMSEVVGS